MKLPTFLENPRRYSLALLSALLLLLIFFNVSVNALFARFGWYLYTKERYEHTIGASSEAVFGGEERGVRVLFCMAEEELAGDAAYSLVLNTMRQLAERHDFIEIEFVNIYLEPAKVRPYRERVMATGEVLEYPITEQSVIFVSGEGEDATFRVETLQAFFVLDANNVITAYNGEEIAISCLAWVQSDVHPVAGFTSTHGENFGELLAFCTVLVASGYDICEIDPDKEIPAGVSLIVIANPRWDFDRGAVGSGVTAELDRIGDFLAAGGSLLVSLDPYVKNELSVLRGFLAERGLTASTAVIRDSENSITYDGYTLVTEPSNSESAARITARLAPYTSSRTIVREASPITCGESGAWHAEPLLLSSPRAQAYENGALVSDSGSYPVLAISSADGGEGRRGTVILSSGIYFMANDVLNSATYANRDVLLSALELATGGKGPVGCRILSIDNSRLEDLTMGTARLYAVLLTLALPLSVTAVGVAVRLRRRTK